MRLLKLDQISALIPAGPSVFWMSASLSGIRGEISDDREQQGEKAQKARERRDINNVES